MCLEDDVGFVSHLPNLDQSIALAQLRCGDELVRSLEFRGLDELHHRVSRREDQGLPGQGGLHIGIDDLLLVRVVLTDVVDRYALVLELSERHILTLDLVHVALIGEQQHAVRVLALQHETVVRLDSLLVPLVGRLIHELAVAELVLDVVAADLLHLVLVEDGFLTILEHGAARHGICGLDHHEVLGQHLVHALAAAEDAAVLLDVSERLGMLLLQLDQLETDELAETHIEDRLRLPLREVEGLDRRHKLAVPLTELDARDLTAHECLLRIGLVLRVPEEGNDGVDQVDGLDETILDLFTCELLLEQVLVLVREDLVLELEIGLQDAPERHGLRPTLVDGQHVHAEGILESRFLIQYILDALDVRTGLQLEHDTDAVFVRLVRDINDLREDLILDELGDILHELHDALADHRVGNLGHDELIAVRTALLLLKLQLAAELKATRTTAVNVDKLRLVGDDAAGREIRSLQVLHHVRGLHRRVAKVREDEVDDLAEIVARGGGRHADRDALGAVQQEVRDTCRQHHRLPQGLIVIRLKRHHRIEVRQHAVIRELLELRLGVSRCGCGVALDRTEVTLAMHHRLHTLEILRHDDQGVVDRGITVRMVLTHRITTDTRRLIGRAIVVCVQLVHIIEHAPLYRLQSVTDVRHRTRGDDRHRVIEVGFLHLLGKFSC